MLKLLLPLFFCAVLIGRLCPAPSVPLPGIALEKPQGLHGIGVLEPGTRIEILDSWPVEGNGLRYRVDKVRVLTGEFSGAIGQINSHWTVVPDHPGAGSIAR